MLTPLARDTSLPQDDRRERANGIVPYSLGLFVRNLSAFLSIVCSALVPARVYILATHFAPSSNLYPTADLSVANIPFIFGTWEKSRPGHAHCFAIACDELL